MAHGLRIYPRHPRLPRNLGAQIPGMVLMVLFTCLLVLFTVALAVMERSPNLGR